MNTSLRVLIVDDSEDDALLSAHELRRGGYEVAYRLVQDAASMRRALDEERWDLILCDWHMPQFSAPAALVEVQERRLELPFLVVSGTVGEETAVNALHAGAHDFITKGRLTRLLPAVRRGLAEAEVREARRKAEREWSKTEARFRAMFTASPVPMWVYDPETLAFLDVNDAAVRQYGYTANEFATMTIADIRPAEELPNLENALRERSDATQVWRHRRKDGALLFVEVTGRDLEIEGRSVRLIVAHDVTERLAAEGTLRRTEDQLRQAQKMEAVGRLAGGVAHDFNNVLSVILTYCQLMAEGIAPADPMRADLDEVEKAARRAADLTTRLLAFTRQQVIAPRVLDVNDVLLNLDKMLRRLVGEDVDVVTLASAKRATVLADQGQLEQVVMNLVVNARDAMPSGGKLTLETSEVVLDEAFALAHLGARPGPHVMLAVTDTGSGMDAGTLARIFEPFFTTKELGKGTGLGLAIVHGIVQKAGGTVWVYSEPGKGTSFKIYWPTTDEARDSSAPVPQPTSLNGTETILLVEDDEQLRSVARTVLARHGYGVIDARSPDEAMINVQRHVGPIDLLLTDVVMPGGSGPDLAARLATERPETRVLYMSGYAGDAAVRHGIVASGMAFVQKPVTPSLLLYRVRQLLDGSRRGAGG
jgi:two-component system cell cycle sensor histidine kinase/response regulator CckA